MRREAVVGGGEGSDTMVECGGRAGGIRRRYRHLAEWWFSVSGGDGGVIEVRV
jgi:hypothetical protein